MNVSTDPAPAARDGLRILDHRGCVTPEALCFVDELGAEQRAVVERHIRACVICAQQQTAIARATERVRAARPRVPVPGEIKQLARQVALRTLAVRRKRESASRRRSTARIRAIGARSFHTPWYLSRTLWAAVLAGSATALVVAVVLYFVI